jgi:hypothetical protein
MNKVLLIGSMLLMLGQVQAQSGLEITTATTLSPFLTATKVMQAGTVTAVSPFATTKASLMNRGVAGREQLKDDIVALNEDMVSGKVKTIDEVRQPALREVFFEISQDEEEMEKINTVVTEGSRLHRIATAVTITLLTE